MLACDAKKRYVFVCDATSLAIRVARCKPLSQRAANGGWKTWSLSWRRENIPQTPPQKRFWTPHLIPLQNWFWRARSIVPLPLPKSHDAFCPPICRFPTKVKTGKYLRQCRHGNPRTTPQSSEDDSAEPISGSPMEQVVSDS